MANRNGTPAARGQSNNQPGGMPASPESSRSEVPEHADAECITRTGSIGAVRRYLRRDCDMPAAGETKLVFDARGVAWELSGDDPFSLVLHRRRTRAEREAWIDEQNASRVCPWFNQDRQQLCRLVAIAAMDVMTKQANYSEAA